jgi:hypothetical protein
MLRWILSGAVFALAACAAADDESTAVSQQAIYGGDVSGEEHHAVLQLRTRVNSVTSSSVAFYKLCTGTVVGRRVVLTALHCVTDGEPRDFVCSSDGKLLSEPGTGALGQVVPADSVTVHFGTTPEVSTAAVGARIISTGSETICINDVAFLIVDRDLDVAPLPMRLERAATIREPLTVVGYGIGGTSANVTRQRREVVVSSLATWPRTFGTTVGPCDGDSGGPALTTTGEIAGVFSTVRGSCSSGDASTFYSDVSFFDQLAVQAFEYAGEELPAADAGVAGAAGQGSTPGAAGQASDEGGTEGDDGGCQLAGALGSRSLSAAISMCALALAAVARRVGRRRDSSKEQSKVGS